MGRPVFYRQRVRSQAASVQAKSLLTHLASEIRARREVSPEEAWFIALDTIRFIGTRPFRIKPGSDHVSLCRGAGEPLSPGPLGSGLRNWLG